MALVQRVVLARLSVRTGGRVASLCKPVRLTVRFSPIRLTSSGSAGTKAKDPPRWVRILFPLKPLWRMSQWRYFRTGLRMFRTGALCIGLFSSGYAMGMHEYLRDPKKYDLQFVHDALKDIGATKAEISKGPKRSIVIHFSDEGSLQSRAIETPTSADYKRLSRVGHRIVVAAGAQVKDMIAEFGDKDSEDKETLECSLRQLQNEWKFILYDSPIPNAFVHALLPGKVFVSTALANHEFCSNDEELAMVLAHELSHAILDHTAASMNAMAFAAAAQLLLLTMLDPTGFLVFLVELLAPTVMKYTVSLPLSRCNETEADQLGLTIAARACFDPGASVKMFDKLYEFETAHGGHHGTWFSDHPATLDRKHCMQDSLTAANQVYAAAACGEKKEEMTSWFRKLRQST